MNSLLSALQGALTNFTKGFLVVAVLPLLLFTAANGLIMRAAGFPVVNRLLARVDEPALALTAAALLVGAATVLSSIQPFLVELLGGQPLPAAIRRALLRRQIVKLDALKARAERAHWLQARLEERTESPKPPRQTWTMQITSAPAGGRELLAEDSAALDALWQARENGEDIDASAIDPVAAAVHVALVSGGTHAAPQSLKDAQMRLRRVIGYARDRARQQFLLTQNQLQSMFPGDVFDPNPSSDNVLAPTRFGNIGRTMRSYALRRYSIDLDIFWTRFQKVMADSPTKMVDALQTQKTQVDFLVTVFWLAVLTGIIWIPWLAGQRAHPQLFRIVALATPVVAWVAYYAACQAYIVFADQVRTAVDFFRFAVLGDLRVEAPPGTEEEEILWQRLGGRIGYANPTDTFIYARPQK